MTRYEGSHFKDMPIELDGDHFFDCVFERCQMVYAGSDDVTLQGCRFTDCGWHFTGCASNTIAFMTALYQAGAVDVIEGAIENIRRGNHPAPPEGPIQ